MSRKSRQKKGHSLLKRAMPPWLAIPVLFITLWIGTVGTILTPLSNKEITLAEAQPVSATLEAIHTSYRSRTGSHIEKVASIYFDFSDHDRLFLENVLCTEATLDKLSAYAAGTVFDMQLYPDSRRIIALSVGGKEIISFSKTLEQMSRESIVSVCMGLIVYAVAAYAAWSLVIRWRYRRIL